MGILSPWRGRVWRRGDGPASVASVPNLISVARILLTLAYVVTRNLWVSTGAHVVNDWTGFLFVYAVGHMPIAGE